MIKLRSPRVLMRYFAITRRIDSAQMKEYNVSARRESRQE